MKTGWYRQQIQQGVVDLYPGAFVLNNPDLTTPVVYARDLGPAKNAQLIEYFPGRKLFWLGTSKTSGELEFLPLEEAQSLPSP